MATRQGIIKKTPVEQFEKVRSTGIRAITVAEEDALAWVGVSSGADDIVLATALGRIARFPEREVRAMGRDAAGVIGIRLARAGDQVVGMRVVDPGADILVLTETGYGSGFAPRVPDHASWQPGVCLIGLEGAKTGKVAPAVELVTEAGRGAAAHQRQRSGRAHGRQERQSLRERGTRGHRHASQRGRRGRGDRGLPGRAGGAARRRAE
ncbi:MAG: DNA gyrase C-terminal beta-propeller domain-containing protein [Chloroflexota bacterium]